MNKKILHTAVALALGSVSSAVLAFDAVAFPPSPANTVVLSGATASSNSVRTWIINNICNPVGSDIRVYRRGGVPHGNDWAVACTIKTTFANGGTTAGQNVLFRKRDAGGSAYGVTPVTNSGGVLPSGIDILSINLANFPSSLVGIADATPAPASVPFLRFESIGSALDPVHPDAGFSDIEPERFIGLNNPGAPLGPFTNDPIKRYNAVPFGGLIFNTPVTTELRNALQRAQFPSTSECHPSNPGYIAVVPTPPNYNGPVPLIKGETEPCMASLTSTEVRSLFTGNIPNWNNLRVNQAGAGAGSIKVGLAEHTDNLPFIPKTAAGANDLKVQLCRRVRGSGTQAQFNAIFTNYPCVQTGRTALEGSLTLTGPIVALNSGSSDVGKCLSDFNNGTNTATNPVVNAALGKRWAIGIQSLENNANLAQNYRFIKIDGYAPTLQRVAAADYQDLAEQSFQYRTFDTVGVPLPAPKPTILTYIAAEGSTPDDFAGVNTAYVHSFGTSGWLATPKFGAAPSPLNPFSLATPVNSWTRAPNNAILNICQFPTVNNKLVYGGLDDGQ